VREKLAAGLGSRTASAGESRDGEPQPVGTRLPNAKQALGVITINENIVGRSFYTKLGGKLTDSYTVTVSACDAEDIASAGRPGRTV
jgi:hypothetical protein